MIRQNRIMFITMMMASPMDPMVKKARGIWSLLRVSHRVIHPRVRIRKSRKVPTFNSALHLYLGLDFGSPEMMKSWRAWRNTELTSTMRERAA